MADEAGGKITDTIETLAKEGFASTSFSQGSSSQSAIPLESAIGADRYLKGEKAKKRPGGGIIFRTIQPPRGNAVSDNGGLILVDRWGIEQPTRKVNGRPQSRKIAATPPEENGPDMRKIRAAHALGRMDIQGTYNLAQTTVDNAKHWAAADNYDADSANSRWVRQTMVKRSRYEAANNGYVDGIQSTHATFVVRKGPRLRILTETEEEAREGSPENIRNEKIKRDWRNWCKRIKFRRKLWTMAHAKIQDGEPIAVVRYNPKVRHDVKLDVCLIETEQCQTPLLPQGVVGYIDGIRFDPWGNPIFVIDDQEREDCNDQVLDPLFSIWWQEYVLFHQSEGEMFDCDPDEPPEHEWDWPRNPVADPAAEVSTNAERLRTGQASPSEIAHENGESWEERLRKLSKDYGKTVDEVREAIFTVTFAPKSGGQLQPGAGPQNEGFLNGFPKKPPAAGDAESGDAAEVKNLAAMVATMSEGILAMQQTLRGIVGQAFQPDTA